MAGSWWYSHKARCDDQVGDRARLLTDFGTDEEDDIEYALVSGSANIGLAMEVAQISELPVLDTDISVYADGEISVKVNQDVTGMNVFVMQPISPTTPGRTINDNLMELILIVSCLKRANAKKVIAVVPYFGYARHDRLRKGRETISAKDVANLLETAGVDAMISVDLHRKQLEGFFDSTPVDSLESGLISIPFFVERNLWRPTIVCPSTSSVTRAKKYMEMLKKEGVNAKLAFMSGEVELNPRQAKEKSDARGVQHGVGREKVLVGSVKHSDVIIVDDMIDTASRVCSCAELVKNNGAKRIFVWTPHGLFSGNAIEKIEHSEINEVLITNTNDLQRLESSTTSKIRAMSIAPLLAEAIRRKRVHQSLASLCGI